MTYHTTEELIGGRSEWAVSPNNFNGLIDSHILANQRISELEAQLAAQHERVIMLEVSYAEKLEALSDANEMLAELESQLAVEKETWRCFHCGFETSDRNEASGHFGEFGEEYPLCIHWSDLDADGKASEFQSINTELEGEREENLKLRQQVEQLEYLTGSQEADISSRFKGCRTINEAFFKYDSMEGRALAAEERISELETALQVAREALAAYANKGNWTAQDEYTLMCNIWRGPEGHTVAEKVLARIEEKEVSRG